MNKPKKHLTTEQHPEKAIKTAGKMSAEERAQPRAALEKKPKTSRMRREYGIGDFLSYIHSDGGMARAAKRVMYEGRQEKLFKDMTTEGQIIQ